MRSVGIFLQSIRWPNLLIIAATQYLIRYCVLAPYYAAPQQSIPFQLTAGQFFLLVLSTLFIAAAGYIINDYFDTPADAVNDPHHVPLHSYFNQQTVFRIYMGGNIIGVGLGIYLGWIVGNFNLGLIHLVITGLLWFYSTHYKKQFLVGNLVIAFLSAVVVLIVGFYERQIYTTLITTRQLPTIAKAIMEIILAYAFFAFMISLLREMVKDVEDQAGDVQVGSKTMPVILGVNKTKLIIGILFLAFLYVLGYLEVLLIQKSSYVLGIYLGGAVILPLFGGLVYLLMAEEKYQYSRLSILLKFVMVTGLLSLVVYRAIFTVQTI